MSTAGWNLQHTYADLPGILYDPVTPTRVRSPRLVIFNRPLAESLGLDPDAFTPDEWASIFAGNRIPPGGAPIAQAYAGHQFGHFTTLGDGRAILLGEQITPNGRRFDIQLKGAGRTPFSRAGDGRAALGPMLREYIISEAMHALGIPTTRSLAVTATGETVQRHRPLPGAVLTRVAASHIRVGTFEWIAALGEKDALKALINYTIERHFSDRINADVPALALLETVIDRQAQLIAQWMLVGFVHGVMNTDNMALSGETIDYGPCAFMDAYDPATVFSSIDRHGRYAYGNQPAIAQWNLARFAETLITLIHDDHDKAVELATEALDTFADLYNDYWRGGMARKLGIFNPSPEDDGLIHSLLEWMRKNKADFTNTFCNLSLNADESSVQDPEFTSWRQQWLGRLDQQPESLEASIRLMQECNPAFIPRNHKVEQALEAAEDSDDLSPLQQLLEVLKSPFDHSRDLPEYSDPAAPGEGVYQTFCGT